MTLPSSLPFAPDVAYQSPDFSSTYAFFMVISFSDIQAKNTTDHLFSGAVQAKDSLTSQGGSGFTVVGDINKGITAGRASSWFTVRSFVAAQNLLTKIILFSSEFHKITYAVYLWAFETIFQSLNPTWDSILGSFRVLDEKVNAAPAGGNTVYVVVVAAAVVASVIIVALALIRQKRRRREASLGQLQSQVPLQTTTTGPSFPAPPPAEGLPPPPADLGKTEERRP